MLAAVLSLALGLASSGQPLPEAGVCPPGTPLVDVRGFGHAEPLAAELAAIAPARYRAIAAAVGADDCSPVVVELTPELTDVEVHGLDWRLPPWAAGAARGEDRRILLTVHHDGQRHDREAVLTHELTHVAVDAARAGRPIPLWFHEGVARTLAGEHGARDAELLAAARLRDRIPGLEGLERGFPRGDADASLAYAKSGRAVRLLVEREGQGVIARLLDRVAAGDLFEDALRDEAGLGSWQLDLRVAESVPKVLALLTVLRQGDLAWATAGLVAVVAFLRLRRKRRDAIDAMPVTEAAWHDASATAGLAQGSNPGSNEGSSPPWQPPTSASGTTNASCSSPAPG